jgi:hypothetical protein
MIGTPDWEKDWYEMSRRTNLFGDTDERLARTAEVDDMEKYFGARLAGLFSSVLPPLRLNDDRGIPQFALFFAISNPKPAAIGLASRIARHILKIRHLIEGASMKRATCRFFVLSAPLLEEKRRPCLAACGFNLRDPLLVH